MYYTYLDGTWDADTHGVFGGIGGRYATATIAAGLTRAKPSRSLLGCRL